MSGFEVVGVVASIVQVANAGLRISQTVYAYADSVKSSDQRLKDVASHLKITSDIVRHVAELFSHDDFGQNVGGKEISTANDCVSKCHEAFSEVEDYVRKAKESKWRFPLREKKLNLLDARLEQLKSSLLLILSVIKNKNDLKVAMERKGQGIVSDQRLLQEVHALREARNKSDLQYELLRKSIETLTLGHVDAEIPMSTIPNTHLATPSNFPIPKYSTSPFARGAINHGHTKPRTYECLTVKELDMCSYHIQRLLVRTNSLLALLRRDPLHALTITRISELYEQYCTSNQGWEDIIMRRNPTRVGQMKSWHAMMAQRYDVQACTPTPPFQTARLMSIPGTALDMPSRHTSDRSIDSPTSMQQGSSDLSFNAVLENNLRRKTMEAPVGPSASYGRDLPTSAHEGLPSGNHGFGASTSLSQDQGLTQNQKSWPQWQMHYYNDTLHMNQQMKQPQSQMQLQSQMLARKHTLSQIQLLAPQHAQSQNQMEQPRPQMHLQSLLLAQQHRNYANQMLSQPHLHSQNQLLYQDQGHSQDQSYSQEQGLSPKQGLYRTYSISQPQHPVNATQDLPRRNEFIPMGPGFEDAQNRVPKRSYESHTYSLGPEDFSIASSAPKRVRGAEHVTEQNQIPLQEIEQILREWTSVYD